MEIVMSERKVLATTECSRPVQCASAAHAAFFLLWTIITYTHLQRAFVLVMYLYGPIGKMPPCAPLLHCPAVLSRVGCFPIIPSEAISASNYCSRSR